MDGHAGGPAENDLGLTSTDMDPEREVGPTPSNSQDRSVLPPQQHATETESEHGEAVTVGETDMDPQLTPRHTSEGAQNL